YFALEVYFPKFRLVPLKRWDQFVRKAQELGANELWIDLVPIPAMRGKINLTYKNQQRFSIHLPKNTPHGLRESWFGTVATKEQQRRVWRAIIRAVRKYTTGGMWIWSAERQVKGFSNRHRYSPAIAEQHARGLILLPFAGGNQLLIREPD